MNKNSFSVKIGLANNVTVGNIVSNRLNKPSFDVIEKILQAFDSISPDWLLLGKGPMQRNDCIIDTIEPKHYSSDLISKIPLVMESAVAGFGNSHFSIADQDVKAYYTVPIFKYCKVDFMIEIYGSSMYPKYSSGDIVACTIIKESKFIQWNKTHVVATREQGILVKRLKKSDDVNFILAVSDNKEYDPFLIPVVEITGMALVVGVIRLV